MAAGLSSAATASRAFAGAHRRWLGALGCRRANSVQSLLTVVRFSSSNATSASRLLVTTPIFYVNGSPHIGHAYSTVLADAIARLLRLKGHDVLFSTGTDEHGEKIATSAKAKGLDPYEFATENSNAFRALFDKLDISYDDFVRTTEDRHRELVTEVWETLLQKDKIYKGYHRGWYSEADEVFVPDSHIIREEQQTVPSDTPLSGPRRTAVAVVEGVERRVTYVEEENYLFRLSEYAESLRAWLEKQSAITPPQRLNEAIASTKGIKDLSVSRPASRVPFAIPVPNDPSQSIYVWLDALFNYMTVSGHRPSLQDSGRVSHWPPHVQVLGKDIIKFHALFFPAFLMALEEELPRRLVVHAHWLSDGKKMSKSLGNIIEPTELLSSFGIDGFRYALLREGAIASDGNFDKIHLASKTNSELADTFGNLISRIAAKRLVPEGVLLPPARDVVSSLEGADELLMEAHLLPSRMDPLLQGDSARALDAVCKLGWKANEFIERIAPWKLRKEEQQLEKSGSMEAAAAICARRTACLHTASVCASVMSSCLSTVAPTTAALASQTLRVDMGTAFRQPESLQQHPFHLDQSRPAVVFSKIDINT